MRKKWKTNGKGIEKENLSESGRVTGRSQTEENKFFTHRDKVLLQTEKTFQNLL